jgi:hypothetical protein
VLVVTFWRGPPPPSVWDMFRTRGVLVIILDLIFLIRIHYSLAVLSIPALSFACVCVRCL